MGNGLPFASAQYTPYDVPAAAQNMRIIPGNGQVTVTWDQVDSRGSTLTSFVVQKNNTNYPTLDSHYSNMSSSNISYSGGSAGSATSLTISGLTNDKLYIIRILPKNTGGDASSFSNIITVKPTSSANSNMYFNEPPTLKSSDRTTMISKGLAADFVIPSHVSVSTSAFSAFDKSFNQKIRYTVSASQSDSIIQKARSYAVQQYSKPSDWSANIVWSIPPAIIPLSGGVGESAMYNVTQAEPQKPLYLPFTDATALENGAKLAGVKFAMASTANNLAVDTQFTSSPPSGVTAISDTKMYMRFTPTSTESIDYGSSSSFSTPPTVSFTMGANATYPHPTNPTNTVNSAIVCPAAKFFLISGSTSSTSGITVSRDTSGDTATTCGYTATLQHFSDYGASIDTSSSTSSTSGGRFLDTQAPSTSNGFTNLDYPLVIDGNQYKLPNFSNTIQTNTLSVSKTHRIVVSLYENSGPDAVQHVSLYMNLKGSQGRVMDSDTSVLWYKTSGITITDPHDFIDRADAVMSKKGNLAEISFEIKFKEPMGKSNLIIRTWDENRNSWDTTVYDALDVINYDTTPLSSALVSSSLIDSSSDISVASSPVVFCSSMTEEEMTEETMTDEELANDTDYWMKRSHAIWDDPALTLDDKMKAHEELLQEYYKKNRGDESSREAIKKGGFVGPCLRK